MYLKLQLKCNISFIVHILKKKLINVLSTETFFLQMFFKLKTFLIGLSHDVLKLVINKQSS